MNTHRLKIGIVGVGKMGTYHLGKFLSIPTADVVGIYEPNETRAQEVAQKFGVRAVSQVSDLLFDCDAIVVAAPTVAHYPIARAALEAGVHVLVEKPIAQTVDEALDLSRIAAERGLILQVGLIERYRCRALADGIALTPVRFIESHRLSPVRPREHDIDVVSDLMIHDLDLALSLIGQEPSSVSAIGTAVHASQVDIANVRLEFPSGAVVNLTASYVSARPMRKFRFFVGEGYASMDFIANSMDYFCRTPNGIEHRTASLPNLDALREQALHFLHCVRSGERPLVNAADGALALKYANVVRERVADRLRRFSGATVPARDMDQSAEALISTGPASLPREREATTEEKPWA